MASWELVKLDDIVTFQEGYVNPSQTNNDYFDGDIKWLRAVDLNDSEIWDTTRKISNLGFESAGKSAVLFKPNTIAISKSGTIGRLGILKDFMCGNRAVINIEVNEEKADLMFVFYSLIMARREIIQYAVGSVQANLYPSVLGKLEIPLPSISIQKKISTILSSLDYSNINNNDMSLKSQEIINTLFRSWFIDFDPVKAKKEGKLPYGMDEETAALFPDTFENTEYGSIPYGWDVTKVDELCKSVDYGFTASSNEDSTGQKFLRITDIIPRQVNWDSVPYCQISDDLLSKYRLEHGDIVIARTGAGVGVAKRLHKPPLNSVFASYLVRIKPKNDVLSIYLGTCLESEQYLYYIQGISYGAGQPQCSAKYLVTFDLVLPPVEILNAFNERVKSLLELLNYTTYQMNSLANTRETLLPRLMSGELEI